GQGSCLYGKTRDHVLELTTVLADGIAWRSQPLRDEELREVQRRSDRVGAIHRAVDTIEQDHCDEIATRFPKLNRCLTGYDLAHGDIGWEGGREFFPEDASGPARGINLIEFVGDTKAEVEEPLGRMAEVLAAGGPSGGRTGYTVARGEGPVGQIWEMRKRSV